MIMMQWLKKLTQMAENYKQLQNHKLQSKNTKRVWKEMTEVPGSQVPCSHCQTIPGLSGKSDCLVCCCNKSGLWVDTVTGNLSCPFCQLILWLLIDRAVLPGGEQEIWLFGVYMTSRNVSWNEHKIWLCLWWMSLNSDFVQLNTFILSCSVVFV